MRYQGPLVDVDVHHMWKSEGDVIAYMPKQWREYVAANPRASFPLIPPTRAASAGVGLLNGARRADTFPPDGSPPGSDYDMLRHQLLDRFNYFRAVLTFDTGQFGTHLNPYFALALCRALNDWNAERWLGLDDRLYSVVCIPNGQPDEAAEEIRRVGKHPRIASVLLSGNGLGRPYGDPLYHPIYEAAVEMGLSVQIHPSTTDPNAATMTAGGPFATSQEFLTVLSNQAMNYISSFVVHGVFEKYPNLKILVKEYGTTWLPHLMMRLDQNYELLRLESPWVKKWPSEYILEHIRLDTQPLEVGPNGKLLVQLLQTVDGIEHILCFGTDYPHISTDEPAYVARHLPVAWLQRIFCDNACHFYGWNVPAAEENETEFEEEGVIDDAGRSRDP